jgi:hypothetical protein
VLDVLNTRLRQSGDQKKGEQGPRSLVALVAGGKGGFAELLHGDQGDESRKLWLSVISVGAVVVAWGQRLPLSLTLVASRL